MSTLSLPAYGISIGDGQKLTVMAGMNVLESRDLAMSICDHLQKVCTRLDVSFIFKASFDKANRSSIKSYRGPGLEEGLKILADVKSEFGVPIVTDYHTPEQAEPVAEVAEVVQVPAFLCRQTDLIVAGAEAVHKRGGWLHVKKAQFLAPWDCKNIITKVGEVVGEKSPVILCERGSSFGYNNLVVDMLGIPAMKALGGGSTGGRREGVHIIAQSAIAAGADGVFLEFHPDPDKALCDGPSCLPLDGAEALLARLKSLHEVVNG